jgi:hypothetical protein
MLGFKCDIAKSPHTLLLREGKLRGSQWFREIWDVDDPLDRLSKRCRDATYRWINEAEHASEIVSISRFSNEISNPLDFHVHFTFGLGPTSGTTSFVRLESSILHMLQRVLPLAKSRGTIRVKRQSYGKWSARFEGVQRGEGQTSVFVSGVGLCSINLVNDWIAASAKAREKSEINSASCTRWFFDRWYGTVNDIITQQKTFLQALRRHSSS